MKNKEAAERIRLILKRTEKPAILPITPEELADREALEMAADALDRKKELEDFIVYEGGRDDPEAQECGNCKYYVTPYICQKTEMRWHTRHAVCGEFVRRAGHDRS